MINMETVVFIDMLNRLAEKTKNGIISFSECLTHDVFSSFVVYDPSRDEVPDEWLLENPSENAHLHLVVLDAIIDSERRDIISHYCEPDVYRVNVMLDSDEEPYVLVSVDGESEEVIIKNGIWRIV